MLQILNSGLSRPAAGYLRHRPETTLHYQLAEKYWPEFQAELANHGKHVPVNVLMRI
jgi:hypothetical protein